MSTVVKVKNGVEPTDQEAERWLAATELASDQRAAILLTRAMFPARYGFAKREPLIPPAADSDCAAKVLWLLKVGQTPTPAAVLTADPIEGSAPTKSAKKLAKTHEWFARQQRAKKAISTTKDVTALSKLLAEAVAAYWREHGTGPHWSEAAAAPEVAQWWTEATGMAYLGKDFQPAIFLKARKLGWIAFNTQERSLCAPAGGSTDVTSATKSRRLRTRTSATSPPPTSASIKPFTATARIGRRSPKQPPTRTVSGYSSMPMMRRHNPGGSPRMAGSSCETEASNQESASLPRLAVEATACPVDH